MTTSAFLIFLLYFLFIINLNFQTSNYIMNRDSGSPSSISVIHFETLPVACQTTWTSSPSGPSRKPARDLPDVILSVLLADAVEDVSPRVQAITLLQETCVSRLIRANAWPLQVAADSPRFSSRQSRWWSFGIDHILKRPLQLSETGRKVNQLLNSIRERINLFISSFFWVQVQRSGISKNGPWLCGALSLIIIICTEIANKSHLLEKGSFGIQAENH